MTLFVKEFDTVDFSKQINHLEKVNKDNSSKVFSMYLNTDPSDPEQQGGKWKIHLKKGLKNFESYLTKDDNQQELRDFQTVKEKVRNFVVENEQNFRKGIILFATADDEVWFAERVQMRVKTEFFWENEPITDQLKQLHENFPKSGIILVQQDRIKLVDAELGEINDTDNYALDIETDNWRQMTGPHKADSSMGSGGKSTQKDNFNARFEANKHRWYKSIAPTVDKKAKEHQWEKIFIVGNKDVASEIETNMNKSADRIIQKNLLDHDESKVLEEIFA
ncbi:VLRF1 family aeRF1-type release factor [Virgibacillus sp. DJP39]|uniref:VLRF1 family aeRF1-type release factor n=1 Tax=Virgibacillus sp. DJP39 TaxID=3409790 RepID=UPI003BB7C9FB